MKWLTPFVEISHDRLGDREREALWARGVSDSQIELYQLGYMNGKLPDLDYPVDFLKWCWDGRRLRDSFVLPLTNTLGSVRGLQFRNVDPDKKGYSDYTPYVEEPITFGLFQAMSYVWETKAIWLVEGVFDVFPIQRVHANIIPTLTNRVSHAMARLLRRLVNHMWLAYDMDKKGREAVKRTMWDYRNDFEVHDVRLPRPKTLDGTRRVKDPNELWETWGDQQFRKCLQDLT